MKRSEDANTADAISVPNQQFVYVQNVGSRHENDALKSVKRLDIRQKNEGVPQSSCHGPEPSRGPARLPAFAMKPGHFVPNRKLIVIPDTTPMPNDSAT